MRADYGDDATIVSVERVSVGGLWGLGARRHYEVVVDVDSGRQAADELFVPPNRALMGLVERADTVEEHDARLHEDWQPSTQSLRFTDLLESFVEQSKLVPADDVVVLNPHVVAAKPQECPPDDEDEQSDARDRPLG